MFTSRSNLKLLKIFSLLLKLWIQKAIVTWTRGNKWEARDTKTGHIITCKRDVLHPLRFNNTHTLPVAIDSIFAVINSRAASLLSWILSLGDTASWTGVLAIKIFESDVTGGPWFIGEMSMPLVWSIVSGEGDKVKKGSTGDGWMSQ